MKIITTKWDEALAEQLDAAAKALSVSRSEFIRQATIAAIADSRVVTKPAKGGSLTESIPAALADPDLVPANRRVQDARRAGSQSTKGHVARQGPLPKVAPPKRPAPAPGRREVQTFFKPTKGAK